MSRRSLKKFTGKQLSFEATFKRYGIIPGKPEEITALLEDLCSNGQYLSDHIWINLNKKNKNSLLNLQPGQRIRFVARVTTYIQQGELGRNTNFGLSKVTNVQKMKRQNKNE